MTPQPGAYTDGPNTHGPNTHHYRTFTRGTSFHVVTVDYIDGDRHTFHVPSEVVNDIVTREGAVWRLGRSPLWRRVKAWFRP